MRFASRLLTGAPLRYRPYRFKSIDPVNRLGIMDAALHAGRLQMGHQRVALRVLHDEQMVHVCNTCPFLRQHDLGMLCSSSR